MFKKLLPHLAALPFALFFGLLLMLISISNVSWLSSNASVSYTALVAFVSNLIGGLLAWRILLFLPRPVKERLFYSVLAGLAFSFFITLETYRSSLSSEDKSLNKFVILLILFGAVLAYEIVLGLARRSYSFAKIAASSYLLLPLLYVVENIRGNRAWESVKTSLEAKGEPLDYDTLIPKPIPDEDNILKAPGMEEWFVKQGNTFPWTDQSGLSNSDEAFASSKPVLGKVTFTVSPEGSHSDLKTNLPTLLAEAQKRAGWTFPPLLSLQPTYARSSPKTSFRQNGFLSARPLSSLPPLHLELKTDRVPTLQDLNAALMQGPQKPLKFKAQASSDPNSFDLVLSAADAVFVGDFLAWSDKQKDAYDLILKASARKGAYLAGNYTIPYQAPIPRFNPIRSLQRHAYDRAQAQLLIGDARQALREIELIHATRRCIASPDFTILATMITANAADLECDIIRQALGFHQWDGEQLTAIQTRVAMDAHLANLIGSLRVERASFVRSTERHFTSEVLSSDVPDIWTNHLLYYGPKGWMRNNQALFARWIQEPIDALTALPKGNLPSFVEKFDRVIEGELKNVGVSNSLALMASPAYNRIYQIVTRAQTQAHLATVACALERHRLDTGAFPENLDSLVTKYLPKIPHQVVSANPLLYRKEADGGCTIWSVGWDLKDDNGNPGTSAKLDDNSPDWAWKLPKP